MKYVKIIFINTGCLTSHLSFMGAVISYILITYSRGTISIVLQVFLEAA